MPFQDKFCDFVLKTRIKAELGEKSMERNSEAEEIYGTRHRKGGHVEKRDPNRVDPVDEEIGLGPYSSIPRKKIILTKKNEENQ